MFWWSTDILSSLIFLQGVDQEILPCRQGMIDSVKINPSLLMMREWLTPPHLCIVSFITFLAIYQGQLFTKNKSIGSPQEVAAFVSIWCRTRFLEGQNASDRDEADLTRPKILKKMDKDAKIEK